MRDTSKTGLAARSGKILHCEPVGGCHIEWTRRICLQDRQRCVRHIVQMHKLHERIVAPRKRPELLPGVMLVPDSALHQKSTRRDSENTSGLVADHVEPLFDFGEKSTCTRI